MKVKTVYLCVLQPIGVGVNVLEGRPKLIAWRERVKKELGVKLFDEAHELIMKASSVPQMLQESGGLELFKPQFKKMFG